MNAAARRELGNNYPDNIVSVGMGMGENGKTVIKKNTPHDKHVRGVIGFCHKLMLVVNF
jgi:hypothetical protein